MNGRCDVLSTTEQDASMDNRRANSTHAITTIHQIGSRANPSDYPFSKHHVHMQCICTALPRSGQDLESKENVGRLSRKRKKEQDASQLTIHPMGCRANPSDTHLFSSIADTSAPIANNC